MAEDGETGTQFISRLPGYVHRWIETAGVQKTWEGLRDKMIAQQFLHCCHSKPVVFLKERAVGTTSEIWQTYATTIWKLSP